jgi:hypothetical protein
MKLNIHVITIKLQTRLKDDVIHLIRLKVLIIITTITVFKLLTNWGHRQQTRFVIIRKQDVKDTI